ncbi:TnsA-like heteromeric transposase endonuclease subunit [Kribbella shirazensis]|uniref:TnsA-like heteromeric transposase endonuclease subunit n=1 Tax=Kribbella shirazensis TaxID=1105143 RepID=A0A7X5V936_9ACTN|nr:TnsA-like heteromeric transposase endonuclease subunit [Kribbella shirazensis]NIK56123.1 hypothetical protein [Kribbella shirazensis]
MVETGLDRLIVGEVLAGLPVREFRWYRGQRHYSGWYWAATTGRLVAYESRLELARILLADFDGSVVGLASQPLWLTGPDGDRTRRHVPDLLLLHADGLVTVVDVKAASRMDDPRVMAQFAWTRQVCAVRGWAYETWLGADPALLENVRFLAGYRRPHLVRTALEPQVLAAARHQSTIGGIEAALAGVDASDVVRPVVLHLVWTGRLTVDLSRPLSAATTVRVAAS